MCNNKLSQDPTKHMCSVCVPSISSSHTLLLCSSENTLASLDVIVMCSGILRIPLQSHPDSYTNQANLSTTTFHFTPCPCQMFYFICIYVSFTSHCFLHQCNLAFVQSCVRTYFSYRRLLSENVERNGGRNEGRVGPEQVEGNTILTPRDKEELQ